MQIKNRSGVIQAVLFILTVVTTTLAGSEWITGRSYFQGERLLQWEDFVNGFHFSIPFLLVLTVHEFGHYFVARSHQVKVTLPYYIPFWFGIVQSIGTMGAFIRIRSFVRSRRIFFDIGVSGPLAGFAVALVLLWYGFTHLPPLDYIFSIHPDYERYGASYGMFVYENTEGNIALGDNLLFWFFKSYIADPALLPHDFEIIHYPYLFAGYLALFFTSLNLIPIGQLDGGHVLYGMIGKRAFNVTAPVLFVAFTVYAGLGLFRPDEFAIAGDAAFYGLLLNLLIYIFFLYVCFRNISDNFSTPVILSLSVVLVQLGISAWQPYWEGYPGFLAFIFVLGRFLGIRHPETADDSTPVGAGRIVLGCLALIIFVISFSPKPFIFI